MNKPIIITVAVTVLLLAVMSWLYLFLFGAPQSPNEVFTDLGVLPGETDTLITPLATTTDNNQTQLDTTGSPLQQLTTRSVAGFWADERVVRYAEQGTGHLYEINLANSTETRLSNTSVPMVSTAIFAQDGASLVLTSESGGSARQYFATLQNGQLDTVDLPPDARNVTFVSTSSVAYTRTTNNGSTGYVYDHLRGSQQEQFTTALQAIVMDYAANTFYLAPAPATELEGMLLELRNNQPTIIDSSEFGLVFDVTDTWYARSYAKNDELINEFVSLTAPERHRSPVAILPEKCGWYETQLVCAAPLTMPPHDYPEQWYKGALRSNDVLWAIQPEREEARLLIDPQTAIGRPLDMTDVVALNSNTVFFINRLDNTLWMYDETNN